MRPSFPFDHLTLAEVAECERLVALGFANTRGPAVFRRVSELLRKRHRPLYDRDPEPDRAA